MHVYKNCDEECEGYHTQNDIFLAEKINQLALNGSLIWLVLAFNSSLNLSIEKITNHIKESLIILKNH